MADEIKHMDIGEFQRLGFLQEANRLFFHPHGLALQITTVTDGAGTWRNATFGEPEVAALRSLLAGEHVDADAIQAITQRLDEGTDWDAGDKWISGVWDYRDDPEGIVFGSGGYGDSRERAETVAAEREKHVLARKALFHPNALTGTNLDIEPLDWTYPEDATHER